ncbi:MAG: sugar kinase [Proteobacteria bacterium]|nr:sugar kinase [Pseudomonadota bacterium]
MTLPTIKSAEECQYDLLALGEVMLRLDPGDHRIRTTRSFQTWEGGGEYNVAKGLSRCFRLRTGIVTALVDNDVGRLVEGYIRQGGVDVSLINWLPFDGIGRTARNGIYFMERGFGIRGAHGVSDRGMTAVSQLKKGDIDWDYIFGKQGVRWFHTGGIFAGLSSTTPDVIEEAMVSARKHGTIVSYDLNYRPSLWESLGGKEKSDAQNRRFKPYLDLLIGVEPEEPTPGPMNRSDFEKAVVRTTAEFPNLKVVASTRRRVHSATRNDWGASCWANGELYEAEEIKNLEIFDRVGGGDGFVAGLIYGLLTSNDPQKAVDYGAALGALAMTTPGDTPMATLAEIEAVAAGRQGETNR